MTPGARRIWSRSIFVAFLAYCLQVTLKATLRTLAGGLTKGRSQPVVQTYALAAGQVNNLAFLSAAS